MKYLLDRRAVLSNQSEYESLYKWSIQELDESDKKIGRDLIPWAWALYFYATELSLRDDLTIEPNHDAAPTSGEVKIKARRYIVGKLRPLRSGGERYTKYSMIGTSRAIEDFTLILEANPEVGGGAKCTAWGGVSYEAEFDFRNEVVPDAITFYVHVSTATFERYAAVLAASGADFATLRVRGVSGFYSDWSPSISTSSIKVLTPGKEHKVEIPEGCDIDPPRLGNVYEAELSLQLTRRMNTAALGPDAANGSVEIEQPQSGQDGQRSETSQGRFEPQVAKLLSSIRWGVWLLALLLLIYLFK